MAIRMAGIDYQSAAIETREKFALTKTSQAELLQSVRCREGVSGCVIINTCNRMELWLSDEGGIVMPYDILCDVFSLKGDAYGGYFTRREEDEAVRHLFELACGLKSMIFGEEQILSQVRESIALAREYGVADPVLQTLFRMAVTAAKKVKTEVRLVPVSRSVANTAVEFLKNRLGELKGAACLVIGSGEMGRQAARGLLAEDCDVTMTLRQYKSGDAVVPAGCRVIDYESRYEKLPNVNIVISATRSPHHTLRYDRVRGLSLHGDIVMFDLALPRDIDPELSALPNIRLYDIDHLGGRLVDEDGGGGLLRARELIGEAVGEFERWRRVRALMPKITELSASASAEVEGRLQNRLRHMALDDSSLKLIREAAGNAVSRVVESVLLSLNETGGGALLSDLLAMRESAAPEEPGREKLPRRFPLFVDISGKKIAVIGAGAVARRRVKALCTYPCRVHVTAPEACGEILELQTLGKLVYTQKPYETSDLEGAYLVVAATDSRELNHRIALDAGKNGQLCSIADCKEECTFYFPATVHYEGGVIGICGTGEDHAGTKEMTAEIREFVRAREDV